MNTFFWGYFSKPWKRLFRTVSLIIILFFSTILYNSNYESESLICIYVLISIPILSYIIEPFVVDRKKKKSKINELDNEPKNEIPKVEIENKLLGTINEQNKITEKNSGIIKYFKFNNEYITGIMYLSRMLVSIFTSILFGLGILLMLSTIYKRTKSLGFNKTLSIINCIIIPLSFIFNLVINETERKFGNSDDPLMIIIPVVLLIPHSILLFKNGTRKKIGKFQLRN